MVPVPVTCPTCRGHGRLWHGAEADTIGSVGTPCGDCSGTGKVAFDHCSSRDGFVASRVTFYASLYPVLREVAYRCGYALCLHGSLAKDLDVLAVPWTEAAVSESELVHALVEAAGGFASPGEPPTDKPHGRRAWTIHLGRDGGYVDLSVMPRRP
jgi:hypothetical protein